MHTSSCTKFVPAFAYIAFLWVTGWAIALHGDTWQYKSAISFMRTRNLEENIAAQLFIWGDIIADKKGKLTAAVQMLPLYQRSQCSANTASYFLLDCQSEILVAGDDSPDALERNVRAEWLKLPSNFSGHFGLRPRQRQVGALLTYNQDIGHFGFAWLDRVWFVLSAPIVSAANNLHPYQLQLQNSNAGTFDTPGNLLQAFNNPTYQAGRIASCTQTKTALAEVNIGFGTEWAHENGFLLWYQTTLDIPSSGRASQEFLFSPTMGTNGHVGWSNTVAIGLPLHDEGACFSARLMFAIANHYYFPHNQQRVFDLYNKPWSRYMLYRSQHNPNIVVPGLNILTQWVRVHPHNYLNLTAGLRGGYAGWELEVGYQLWAHNAEKIQFLKPKCNTIQPVIEDFGIAFPGGGTASKSTIDTLQPEVDPTFVHLYQNDINRNSGATQNARSQMVNIEIGYRGDFGYGAFGVFVERPKVNTSLAQWGLWGSIGLEF